MAKKLDRNANTSGESSSELTVDEFDPLDYRVITDSVIKALFETATQPFPLTTPFLGAGVYMIYYRGPFELYAPISRQDSSIYVGRAIPEGGRKGRASDQIDRPHSPNLFNRLRDHWTSIDAASNLSVSDFVCRYLVVTPIWIDVAEAMLIERFRPVWNVIVNGFGLHHVGKTRFSQKRSDWDVLHPGREWAANMAPGKSIKTISDAVRSHFAQ